MTERLPNETDRAWQAYQDFRAMGKARSVIELLGQYKAKKGKGVTVPTTSDSTLRNWAFENRWSERVKEWDEEQDRRDVEAQSEARRRKWEADVERYRKQNLEIGSAAAIASVQLLRLGTQALAYVDPSAPADKKKNKPGLTTDQAIRAIAAAKTAAELAKDTQGTALQIDSLLKEFGLS